MPAGDRTGPEGRGAMTGRARGYCAGYDEPGFTDNTYRRGRERGFGRGMGRGMGRGRGFAWRARAFVDRVIPTRAHSKEDEIKALEEEQKALDREKEDTNKRLEELKK
ncbi:hypothetical protein GF323_03390 [Candidatus Woesearchaeota archaeon]|nr:hypothetical protein [Candidatus Woesearchaeota archaeon]